MSISIERRSDLSYGEFIEKYQKTGTPVILENATDAWILTNIKRF